MIRIALYGCGNTDRRCFTFPDKIEAPQDSYAPHAFRIPDHKQGMFSHGQILEQYVHAHLDLEADQRTIVQLFQPPAIPLGITVHLYLHAGPFKLG